MMASHAPREKGAITEEVMRQYNCDCYRLRSEGGFDEYQLLGACFDAKDLRGGNQFT